MSSSGYAPPRDQVRLIVGAARQFRKVVRRWKRYAPLPGFPAERGNHSALKALFELERALNPARLTWGDAARKGIAVTNWPEEVTDGLIWLRNLAEIIIERYDLGSMAAMENYEAWRTDAEIPQIISINEDEMTALSAIINLLPKFGSKDVVPAPPVPDDAPAMAERGASNPFHAVILFGPRVAPIVLGRMKARLTPLQFRAIKSLLDAGSDGLSRSALDQLDEKFLGTLEKLAASDEDWGAVIHFAEDDGDTHRIETSTVEMWARSHTRVRRTASDPLEVDQLSAPLIINHEGHAQTAQNQTALVGAKTHRLLSESDLANELRRLRRQNQAALVELLAERETARFEEIAHEVQGNSEASDESIRKLVSTTNKSVEELNFTIRYSCASGRVFRVVHPE